MLSSSRLESCSSWMISGSGSICDLVPSFYLLICSKMSILTISSRVLLPWRLSRGMSSMVGEMVGISDFQSFLLRFSIYGWSCKFSSLLERATSYVLNLSFNYEGDSIAYESSFSSSCNFLIELFILFNSVLCTYISVRTSFFFVTIGLPSNYSGFSPISFKGKLLGLVVTTFVIVLIEPVLGRISPPL